MAKRNTMCIVHPNASGIRTPVNEALPHRHDALKPRRICLAQHANNAAHLRYAARLALPGVAPNSITCMRAALRLAPNSTSKASMTGNTCNLKRTAVPRFW